jgi:hypothetical protein
MFLNSHSRFKGKQGLAPGAYLTEIAPERVAIIASATKNQDMEALKNSPNESPSGSRKNSFFDAKLPRPSLDIVTNLMKKLSPSQSPELTRTVQSRGSVDTEQPTGGVEIIKNMMEVSTLPTKKPGEEDHGSQARSSPPVVVAAPADSQGKISAFRKPSAGELSGPGSGKAPPRRKSISVSFITIISLHWKSFIWPKTKYQIY